MAPFLFPVQATYITFLNYDLNSRSDALLSSIEPKMLRLSVINLRILYMKLFLQKI